MILYFFAFVGAVLAEDGSGASVEDVYQTEPQKEMGLKSGRRSRTMGRIVLLPVAQQLITDDLKKDTEAVKNLIGEPDYRKIKLHWESDVENVPSNGFQVRYCELQSWGIQRCRMQGVTEPEDSNAITEDGAKSFSADIGGLRMATTYSLEVRTHKDGAGREDRADGDGKNQNIIVIPTKGFSARATQCLPHASIIEVSTGPHFGGRIAVEAADGERCALDGEPTSPRDIYTLRINHTECGSQVNDTTVATFVIVQENLPILTHSTRRFLVLCSYQPETLTVRAGISLPTSGRGQSDAIAFEEGDSYARRSRHLRPARLFQGPEALVNEEEEELKEEVGTVEKSIPIALLAVFMTMAFVGIMAAVVKCGNKRMAREMDNVSIASSDTTSSSCITEISAESKLPHQSERIQHV